MIAAAKIKYLQEQIARNDDPVAYKELFVSFYNPLLRFAITLVKSKEQAEEVAIALKLGYLPAEMQIVSESRFGN